MTKKTENKTHVFLIVSIPGGAYRTKFFLFPNSCILEMYRKKNKQERNQKKWQKKQQQKRIKKT